MCTVLLPPGFNPIAVTKYVIISINVCSYVRKTLHLLRNVCLNTVSGTLTLEAPVRLQYDCAVLVTPAAHSVYSSRGVLTSAIARGLPSAWRQVPHGIVFLPLCRVYHSSAMYPFYQLLLLGISRTILSLWSVAVTACTTRLKNKTPHFVCFE